MKPIGREPQMPDLADALADLGGPEDGLAQ